MMDLFDFLQEATTLKVEPKSWMTGGEYTLARATNATLPGIIDACIASGRYALDLETTGLDSRVFDGETVSKIVGCCLSPDGKRGYYIPLRHRTGTEHNVSWSLWKREMLRLVASPSIAVFHNGKFDQEFLQNCGGEPIGEWDEPKKWDDTLILAYLRDTRAKSKGLKYLSKTELGMEMIELEELFPEDKRKGGLDFSELDPSWEPVTWYGASDAICTWNLYQKLAPAVLQPSEGKPQVLIYTIEKLCVPSTRWMERARILTDQNKARELIRIGQREWIAALEEVYESSSALLDRDIRPGYYRILRGTVPGHEALRFDPEVVEPSYSDRIDAARTAAMKGKLDPLKEKGKVATVVKRVPSLVHKGHTEDVEFPVVYDVLSAQQLGALLRECKVPGLSVTEKSGQVDTSKDTLEEVLESAGDRFPFAAKIKRFREVSKALSTYLLPIIEDAHTDGTLRAYFNAFSIETGRFNAPSSKDPKVDGGTRFPFHGTPATYDPNRPECLGRVRECIIARPGKVLTAIDFSGVELRIVTNLSGEQKWLREFFHCSGCDKMFSMPTKDEPIPVAPPPFCPDCGSDKIGDLHTLTGIAVYGDDAPKRDNWKQLRGFAKCVHPDTLVMRDGALMGIGSIVGEGPEDTFTPYPSGHLVWSGTGGAPVRDVYHGGVKPLFHVVTNHGILTCSDAHKIKLADGSLKALRDGLSVGDVLEVSPAPELTDAPYNGIPIKLNSCVPPCIYTPSHDTAYFAGLLHGDGSTRNTSSMIIHGHVEKTDRLGVPYRTWQDILVKVCERLGFNPIPRKEGVYLGSAILSRFLEHLGLVFECPGVGRGKANRTLRIPRWVLEAGPTAIYHFIGGLVDTDGTVSRDGSISITTKDAIFAGQVAASMRACGKHAMVEPSWNKTYGRWYYRIRIPASQSFFLRDFMRHPGKVGRLRDVPTGTMKTENKVIQVIPAGDMKCVDLHLGTEDHLYWANGLITHNSCNFALCYGGGGNAVVTAVGCDKNEGWRIKEQFDKTYNTLSNWWKLQHQYAKKYKYVVTAFGRRYPLPDIDHELGGFRSKAERNAVNGPVQGTSADITKIAMGLIYKECKKRGWLEKVHMLITMHDELVFEIDKDILEEAIDLFVGLMCRNDILLRLGWAVPLTSDVEMGPDWTVPWDLKKIRKKGECPPELDGCFKGVGPKVEKPKSESQPKEKTAEIPTVTHKVKSFSLGEIEPLARLIHAGMASPEATLKVVGPNDEDLTASLSTVWGGRIPRVRAT